MRGERKTTKNDTGGGSCGETCQFPNKQKIRKGVTRNITKKKEQKNHSEINAQGPIFDTQNFEDQFVGGVTYL